MHLKTFAQIFLLLSPLIIAACDTLPVVRSEIPLYQRTPDMGCVRKVVEATPGITFEKQERHEANATCADCEVRSVNTYYLVNENKVYKRGNLQYIELVGGRVELRNLGRGEINKELPLSDRLGFEKAQAQLNSLVTKKCHLGNVAPASE